MSHRCLVYKNVRIFEENPLRKREKISNMYTFIPTTLACPLKYFKRLHLLSHLRFTVTLYLQSRGFTRPAPFQSNCAEGMSEQNELNWFCWPLTDETEPLADARVGTSGDFVGSNGDWLRFDANIGMFDVQPGPYSCDDN